jgi:hypothetical protein
MKYQKPKTSVCSTGRDSRVLHSTSMEWDEVEKKKRLRSVKYSTSEDGQLKHSTGLEFDRKVKERMKEENNDKAGGAKHPGLTYKSYRKNEK